MEPNNMKDKIVYFAAAIRGDRLMSKTIIELVNHIKSLDFIVLTEHVGTEDPIGELASKIGKKKEDIQAIDIEERDIEWLDKATHVIAEISGASTGTGREIEYARLKGYLGKTYAKILCLYNEDREFYASPMIRGMTNYRYPNVFVAPYKTLEEAKRLVEGFLEK